MNAYEQYIRLQDDSAQQEVYLDACVEMMDEAIREKLHRIVVQEMNVFLKQYCAMHYAKFDEEFIVN